MFPRSSIPEGLGEGRERGIGSKCIGDIYVIIKEYMNYEINKKPIYNTKYFLVSESLFKPYWRNSSTLPKMCLVTYKYIQYFSYSIIFTFISLASLHVSRSCDHELKVQYTIWSKLNVLVIHIIENKRLIQSEEYKFIWGYSSRRIGVLNHHH